MSALGNKEVMASNIRRYLEEMGISRKEFCNRLGFKYSTVTDWLNAEKYPRIDKIETMANFFGISKADLVEPPQQALPAQHLPHDGRHTCASLLDNAGINLKTIQLILGHRSANITHRVYTHKTIEQLVEAINQI